MPELLRRLSQHAGVARRPARRMNRPASMNSSSVLPTVQATNSQIWPNVQPLAGGIHYPGPPSGKLDENADLARITIQEMPPFDKERVGNGRASDRMHQVIIHRAQNVGGPHAGASFMPRSPACSRSWRC
jgi:hypothetical protein